MLEAVQICWWNSHFRRKLVHTDGR